MRIYACGGKRFNDRAKVFAAMDAVHQKRPITLLLENGCRNADEQFTSPMLATMWADERGVNYVAEKYIREWTIYHKRRGPGPTREIITEFKPDGLIIFPGSREGKDAKIIATELGIPVWEPY